MLLGLEGSRKKEKKHLKTEAVSKEKLTTKTAKKQ